MMVALLSLALLAAIAGLLLGAAALYCKNSADPMITSINALLPQSQCGQCSYPGCRPYAMAVAKGEAIDKCVPGGRGVVIQLANLLNVEPPPVDIVENTVDKVVPMAPAKQVALIDEAYCIGCTKCLQVCPVDAIIGTARAMHTVLTDYCTGCDLCVAPCPTQCIQMIPIEQIAEQRLLDEIAANRQPAPPCHAPT